MTTRPLYPKLDPRDLEPHYCRHLQAMTAEDLHSKADIAIQLAWRDQQLELRDKRIAELEARYERCHCGADLAPTGFNHCEDCPSECAKCQAVGADCGLECRQ
jgi:hypothetical protein